jgi:SAM-dependent methyltransferase
MSHQTPAEESAKQGELPGLTRQEESSHPTHAPTIAAAGSSIPVETAGLTAAPVESSTLPSFSSPHAPVATASAALEPAASEPATSQPTAPESAAPEPVVPSAIAPTAIAPTTTAPTSTVTASTVPPATIAETLATEAPTAPVHPDTTVPEEPQKEQLEEPAKKDESYPEESVASPEQYPLDSETFSHTPAPNPSESADLLLPDQPDAPNADEAIEPDDAGFSDLDSSFGDSSESYTTSIASSVFAYKYENGRRYHAYQEGKYIMPNDEQEQQRLDLLHHVHLLCLDGELFRAPIKTDVHRVLDVGTGTGLWAIEFADRFPTAEVVGVDLSPIQPEWVPNNVRFIVDDVEEPWLHAENAKFDYIHIRTLGGSIKDWPQLFKQCYDNLSPGGWIELQEFETWMFTDDNTFPEKSNLVHWLEELDRASKIYGAHMNVAELHGPRLKEAGFINVKDDVYKIPMNPWPKDSKLKELGRYEMVAIVNAVEPYCLALFTRVLGMSNEAVQTLLVGVRDELRNPNIHVYAPL